MQHTRTFHLRWMRPQARPGDDFTAPADDTVVYSGAALQAHCSICATGARRS
jgi:hypothetical protein